VHHFNCKLTNLQHKERGSIVFWKGKERKGKERKGKERKGKERKGKERKGKERKGKERKGKEEDYLHQHTFEHLLD
jgi:hypothetical protein